MILETIYLYFNDEDFYHSIDIDKMIKNSDNYSAKEILSPMIKNLLIKNLAD